MLVAAPKLARQILRHLDVEALVDGRENLAIHQLLDYKARFDSELLGEFFDRDAFANRDFTIDRRRSLFLPLLRTKLAVQLAFHVPLAIDVAGRTRLRLMPATGFGRRRRGWLDTAKRRSRMSLRTAAPHLRRTQATARPESDHQVGRGLPARDAAGRGKSAVLASACSDASGPDGAGRAQAAVQDGSAEFWPAIPGLAELQVALPVVQRLTGVCGGPAGRCPPGCCCPCGRGPPCNGGRLTGGRGAPGVGAGRGAPGHGGRARTVSQFRRKRLARSGYYLAGFRTEDRHIAARNRGSLTGSGLRLRPRRPRCGGPLRFGRNGRCAADAEAPREPRASLRLSRWIGQREGALPCCATVGGRNGPEASGGRRGEGRDSDGRAASPAPKAPAADSSTAGFSGSAITTEELRSWISNSGLSCLIGSSGSSATATAP